MSGPAQTYRGFVLEGLHAGRFFRSPLPRIEVPFLTPSGVATALYVWSADRGGFIIEQPRSTTPQQRAL